MRGSLEHADDKQDCFSENSSKIVPSDVSQGGIFFPVGIFFFIVKEKLTDFFFLLPLVLSCR